MGVLTLLMLGALALGTTAYLPSYAEHGINEALVREVVDKMGRDLESYLEEADPSYPQLMSRSFKDSDYQDSPSPRDQEYLQHSTLWANLMKGASNDDAVMQQNGGVQKIQPGAKQENLPAYCNPPNPCPIGYTGEEECLVDFENTAAFSRDYQSQQDCMCDTEHMFDCSSNHLSQSDIDENELDRLVQQFHVDDEHQTLVAKKFHTKKSENPFLVGEKLPVAAKKGIDIGY